MIKQKQIHQNRKKQTKRKRVPEKVQKHRCSDPLLHTLGNNIKIQHRKP